MKDRVQKDIGAKGQLKDWSSIDWKTVKKRVKNLRQRIYRATQNGEWNKVRSLTKLMLRSYSNLLLSVRRVTQENQGKKTAGVDGQIVLTPAERAKLVNDMLDYSPWKARPVKRVYIARLTGSKDLWVYQLSKTGLHRQLSKTRSNRVGKLDSRRTVMVFVQAEAAMMLWNNAG